MKQYIFTETGEVRKPKAGEWFESPSGNIAECHSDAVTYDLKILKREVINERWKPKPREIVFLLSQNLNVIKHEWLDVPSQNELLKLGLLVKTQEEAQEVADKFKQVLEDHHGQ